MADGGAGGASAAAGSFVHGFLLASRLLLGDFRFGAIVLHSIETESWGGCGITSWADLAARLPQAGPT